MQKLLLGHFFHCEELSNHTENKKYCTHIQYIYSQEWVEAGKNSAEIRHVKSQKRDKLWTDLAGAVLPGFWFVRLSL